MYALCDVFMKEHSIFNKFIALTLCLLLMVGFVIASLFVIPPKYAHAAEALADGCFDPYHVDLGITPILAEMTTVTPNGNQYCVASSQNVFAALYKYYNFGDKIGIVFATKSEYYDGDEVYWTGYTNSAPVSYNLSDGYHDQDRLLHYREYKGNYDTTWDFPVTDNYIFEDISSALDALSTYEPVVEPSLYEGIAIPRGYLARIKVSSNAEFDITTNFPVVSQMGQWPYSNQKFLVSDSSDPTSIGTIDYGWGTRVPWFVYGKTNLLNQGFDGMYHFSDISGDYVYIINPFFYGSISDPTVAHPLNSKVFIINIVGVESIRLYDTKTSVNYSSSAQSGGITNNSPTDYEDYDDVLDTDDDGERDYVDQDGNPTTPPTGSQYNDESEDPTGGVAGFLERFSDKIISLLEKPIDHIESLVSAGEVFFTSLTTIWSWLPLPVMTILTDILYIMLVVGCIKVLWR